MSRRTTVVLASCAAAALLATGGIVVGTQGPSGAEAETVSSTLKTTTATAERGDLRGITTKIGGLAGRAGPTVGGGPAGTLTSVSEEGEFLRPRDELYRVDDQPVTYFSGALPLWRSFESGMADGADVTQLEQNLHAWGYLGAEPDRRFDWRTRAAIDSWQRDTGQPRTGSIERGRIWFGTGTLVVSERKALVGQTLGPGVDVLGTRSTTKVVSVALPVGSSLAKEGGAATVRLPGGGTVPGRITSVGQPSTDSHGRTTVPVAVGIDDQARVKALDRVEVPVDLVSATRKDALSVPVIALGARASGGFVVEVVGADGATTSVPVTVGLFAGDRVEITGGSLRAGQNVVVPA